MDIESREKELAGLREELRDAEMVLNSELSRAKKSVKLMEHTLSRKGKLTPIQKNTLRDFIRDPLKSAVPDKGFSDLQAAVKSAARHASRLDSRDLMGIDMDALVERTEKELPEARSRYIGLMEKASGVEKELKELSRLSSSKQGIEGEIRKISEQSGVLEEQARSLQASKSRISEQVRASLKDLETRILEEAQKRVVISASQPK